MGGVLNKIKSDIAKNKENRNLNAFVKIHLNLQKILKISKKKEKILRLDINELADMHKNRQEKMEQITKEYYLKNFELEF